ncbi:MAG: hypothetical protein A2X94_13035 [Bdellovibrionales bacterium GWB1_55_8]|nr:MAG: hypothetical protein A2X94_13035 [Bdellovibrionales bacterium GWB1_55_8]
MKLKFMVVCMLALLTTTSPAGDLGQDPRIIDTAGNAVSIDQLGNALSDADIVVLAEKHHSADVQRAEAEVIRTVIRARKSKGLDVGFTTAWEFLNYTDKRGIEAHFSAFREDRITKPELLRALGNDQADTYIPILEATRDLGGELMGVNLPRKYKAPVVKSGISAADRNIIPPGFQMCDERYFERFESALEEQSHSHTKSGSVRNLFAAQCLTDDVIAYRLLEDTATLKFLVVGSIHADFGQGTVQKLRARAPDKKTQVVRFFAESEETNDFDQRPGIAEYVFYLNES